MGCSAKSQIWSSRGSEGCCVGHGRSLERILANPLPVDVTSTWWDYVVDVADVLAGLGTMGALVVAAMVYRRQEHDKRIIQASRIIVSATIDEAQSTAMITVRNRSDLRVYGVSFYQNDWMSAATRS